MRGFRFLAVLAFAAWMLPVAVGAQHYPDTVRESLYVPVRDGTRLAVNVYRPAVGGEAVARKLPVVFVFTPYRARYRADDGTISEVALDDRLALRSLLRAGYVVAVADIRGKGASFGARFGFQSREEARDGHDLVEWLARQPFSTGTVGMIGCSYLGGTTFHTASTAPPSLKAVVIGATDLDKYTFVRNGGITAQFNTRPDEDPSIDLSSIPVDADSDGSMLRAAVAEHAANTSMAGLWYSMPYRDDVSPLTDNAFWEEASPYNYLEAIRDAGIATLFWSNWTDEPTGQTIKAAENLDGRLLVGPGTHCVPPPGSDFANRIVRYFDGHLKDDAVAGDEPRVTYWVHDAGGTGTYRGSDERPGARSDPATWYLGAQAEAALGPARGSAGSRSFTVDYDLPPTGAFTFWVDPMGEHGASFSSAPLALPQTLVGFPVAHLKVSASTPDAPVFVYLEREAADGTSEVLSFGRLLLSHRAIGTPPYDNLGLPWHSGRSADAAPLPPGDVADLAIEMTPISHVIRAGERLRLVVTGADPRQRNLAQIRQTPAPELTVHFGGADGSRLELPVAPAGSD